MSETPASPKTLDALKDAFLKNAIVIGDRAFNLREFVLGAEAELAPSPRRPG